MDMILSLVVSGVKKLVDLVPLWMKSSAEERAKIEADARTAVGKLDEIFLSADARDAANTAAARSDIARASDPTKP